MKQGDVFLFEIQTRILSLSSGPIFEQNTEISPTWEIEEFSASVPTKER